MTLQIFLDTEFTDFAEPKLISIGLAASTGEHFYAEVDYALEDCSDFVREIVVPLLWKKGVLSKANLLLQLVDWLEKFQGEGPVLVCYDSDFDRTLFEEVFKNKPPPFVIFRKLGARHINELKRYEYHVKNKRPQHHALYDACALRHSFRGWIRDVR